MMQFPEITDIEPQNGPLVSYHLEEVDCMLPDQDLLFGWFQKTAAAEKIPLLELNFIFCSDEYLLEVNTKYLQHDFYTDVITFPYAEDSIYGDVFISIDRVDENARNEGVSFFHELCRVMLHGLLHLAGYKDETDEEEAIMRAKENQYLQAIESYLAAHPGSRHTKHA
jgi:probable rRNA maturation factor